MEKYSVIYANPPWMYNRHHQSASNKGNYTEDYKVSGYNGRIPLEEILALPVDRIVEDNCVLFLWAPTPLLPEAFNVINSWGFAYKTLFTWEKLNDGCMGYWFTTCTEHLLVSVKGNVKAFRSDIRNCYHEPQIKGGQKPDFFYHLIERVTTGKRVELFARRHRKGWDAWRPHLNDSLTTPGMPLII